MRVKQRFWLWPFHVISIYPGWLVRSFSALPKVTFVIVHSSTVTNLKPFHFKPTSIHYAKPTNKTVMWMGWSFFLCFFTFVSRPQNGKEECYEKWRVENSWGDDRGNKGEGSPSVWRLHVLPNLQIFGFWHWIIQFAAGLALGAP